MDIYPITHKHCTKCNVTKSIENFSKHKSTTDGFRNQCKDCIKQYNKQYQIDNKKTIMARDKKYYQNNRDTIKNRNKKYYQANALRLNTRNKEYRETHKDTIRIYNKEYKSEKRKTDSLFKLADSIRKTIARVINRKGYLKKSYTFEILGCSYQEFHSHLEKQFVDGMNWDNRAEWHLDHIIPVSFAQNEKELIMLNHYTNFQPLWASDNIVKSDTITEDTINHPLFKQLIENRKHS